jgi:phosphocarrier protein HPr
VGEARREIQIVNKRGLHARASAKFVAAVSTMGDCEIFVAKDGNRAAGGSILGLMMLGAAKGDTIELVVTGDQAESRLEQLAAMIEGGFGED